MEMQLSSSDVARYDGSGGGSARARQAMRPNSSFGGDRYPAPQGYDGRESRQRGGSDMELKRERSKSLANIPFRPAQAQVLHYGELFANTVVKIPC